jgi:hypothetical protein
MRLRLSASTAVLLLRIHLRVHAGRGFSTQNGMADVEHMQRFSMNGRFLRRVPPTAPVLAQFGRLAVERRCRPGIYTAAKL